MLVIMFSHSFRIVAYLRLKSQTNIGTSNRANRISVRMRNEENSFWFDKSKTSGLPFIQMKCKHSHIFLKVKYYDNAIFKILIFTSFVVLNLIEIYVRKGSLVSVFKWFSV